MSFISKKVLRLWHLAHFQAFKSFSRFPLDETCSSWQLISLDVNDFGENNYFEEFSWLYISVVEHAYSLEKSSSLARKKNWNFQRNSQKRITSDNCKYIILYDVPQTSKNTFFSRLNVKEKCRSTYTFVVVHTTER